MKKKLITIMIFMLVAVFATACTSSGPGSSGSDSTDNSTDATQSTTGDDTSAGDESQLGKGMKVGFALSNLENVIWNRFVDGMKKGAAEMGAEFQVANADSNAEKQISNIENFITQKYDAIIIHAFDVEAFADVAQKALDAGIIVCAYDDAIRDPVSGKNVGYQLTVGCDNREMGRRIGQMAADWISKQDWKDDEKIEFGVFNYPTWEFIVARSDGMKEALQEAYPNVEFVAEQAALLPQDGVELGENWITAHPNMKGIVAINDNALCGFVQAWTSSGKDINDPNFGTFGADAITDGVNYIAQGSILRGDCGLDVFSGGHDIVQACIKFKKGVDTETDIIFPMTSITADNVEEWMADPNLYQQ